MTTDGDHNLHQKVFLSTFHFDIPVVKCFDTNSRYPKPTPKGVFCISAFRHFDIPVVKCFYTPTPGILNFEMESDRWSSILAFHILVFQHFYHEAFRHFQLLVSKTLKWSQINGLVFGHFVFQRFIISVMKCFDTSNSQYPKLRNGVISTVWYFGISHFMIFCHELLP
jgi:hypothetical protein